MTVIYYEDDADLAVLAHKVIGIIGYGALGRIFAHHLREHDLNILISGDENDQRAAQMDGFTVGTPGNVCHQAQVVLLLLPDESMTAVYMQHVSPNLQRGDTLIFSSAYNVAFGFIEPPPFVDVGLVAPRATDDDDAVLSFVSVWQDASRHTWDVVLAVAFACGALRAGALEVSIKQEAEINLFIQQAILPAFYHIMTTAAQLMLKEGYPTEAVLLDLYLSGKFSRDMQHIAQAGWWQNLQDTPKTGQYGTLSRLVRFEDLKLQRLMEVTLEEIRNGAFAREWSEENADNHPRLKKLLKRQEAVELWELEQQTLDLIHEEDNDFL